MVTATTVSFSGLSLTGADAGNYTLTAHTDDTAARITARTVGLTANKVYDGTTDLAGHVTVTTGVTGETLSYSGATASSARVATSNKFIQDITFGDAAAGSVGLASNYQLPTLDAANAPVTISAKSLTLSLTNTGVTKVYDGTTNAPVGFTPSWTVSGLVSGDTAADFDFTAAAYNDANVSAATTLTLSGLTVASVTGNKGSQTSDYALVSNSESVGATISKANLTVRANDDAHFFTQSVTGTAAFNGVSYSGFVNGETSSVLSGSATVMREGSQTDAGTYLGVLAPVTSGLTTANYNFTAVNGDYTIVPAGQLLVKVQNASTIYGTDPSYTITSAQYLDSDNSTIATISTTGSGNSFAADGATFSLTPKAVLTSTADRFRAGSYQLGASVTSGNSGNFSNTITVVGALEVATKGLTASASGGVSKVYDGTTSMSGVTLGLATLETNGAVTDAVTVNGLGAFGSRNVGVNIPYTISGLTLSGNDAGNYHLSSGGSFSGTGEITRANASVSATVTNLTYNGQTQNQGAPTSSGFVVGDAITITGVASGRNAGSYASALQVSGDDADNYNITITNNNLVIDKANLTLSAVTDTKTYDATTASGQAVTVTGLQVGDAVTGMVQSFDSQNSGNRTLSVNAGFTVSDGNSGLNYNVITHTASGTIDKANLTLSGTRVYDGGRSFAGQYLTATGVNGETFAVTGSGDASNLVSKNVADNPAGTLLFTVTGLALGNSTNGGLAGNYNDLSTTGSSVSLSKASATVSATATNVTYNGATQNQTAATSSGFFAGDAVVIGGEASGKNAGSYTSNLTVGGADADNYDVSITNADLVISKAALTVTGNSLSTTYNSTSQSVSGFAVSGLLGSDQVSDLSGISASGASARNVGSYANTVTVTDQANYTVTGVAGSLEIARASATVSATATNVTYNGATQNQTAATSSGFFAGDAVVIGGEASGKNAGSYTSNLTVGGADADNYDVSITNADLVIGKASATVTAINATKTYDAQPYSGGAGVIYSGLVAGETEAVLSGTLSYSGTAQGAVNVGSYTITPGGLSSVNYHLTFMNGSLLINPAGLSAIVGSLTGTVSKVYDGNNSATLVSSNFVLNGWLGNDGAVISQVSGAYDSVNAGTGKTVTVNLSASDFTPTGSTVLSNYSLPTSISGAVGVITPATLEISGISASDKVYDGNTSVVLNTTAAVKSGLIHGDAVDLVANGFFADKNVGVGKVVSITGLMLSGASAGNYQIGPSSLSTTANISPATLQVTNAIANDKTFDGTNTATVIDGRIAPISGDVVFLSAPNATFADAAVGVNKPVSTLYTLTGTDAGNYTLVQPSGLTASINAAPAPAPEPTPVVSQLIVTPSAPVTVVPTPQTLVTVTPSSSPSVPSPVGSAPISVDVSGVVKPLEPKTSAGTGVQDNVNFVAVKSFDVVKIAPGIAFSLTLPEDTFIHSLRSTPLQISAKAADGGALPDWIDFSPTERRFTGTPPRGVTTLQVVVEATDSNGNQVSTSLTLQFGETS